MAKTTSAFGGAGKSMKSAKVAMSSDGLKEKKKLSARKVPATCRWQTYVYRTFKETAEPDFAMKKHTAVVFNGLVNDMIERIGTEAGLLCRHTNSKTMKGKDIMTAISLVTRNTELARVMNQAGTDAVKRYMVSVGKAPAGDD